MVGLTIHVKEREVHIYNTPRVSNNFSRFCCIQKFNTMQFSSNSSNINSTLYSPMWRLFHCNLSSKILCPSHKCVYNILFNRLRDSHSKSSEVPIVVKEHFQYSMFCAYWFLLCVLEKPRLKKSKKSRVRWVCRVNVLLTCSSSRRKWHVVHVWLSMLRTFLFFSSFSSMVRRCACFLL